MNKELIETEVRVAADKMQRKLTPSGPGKRLHAARMAANLPIEAVAVALHLTTQMVTDLEEDNYSRFAGHTFIRGYLRNYARLLKLAPDEIILAFNNLELTERESDKPKLSLKTTYQKPPFSLKKLLLWLVLLAGLVAAVGLGNYLVKYAKTFHLPLNKPTEQLKQEQPKQEQLKPEQSTPEQSKPEQPAPVDKIDELPLILPSVPAETQSASFAFNSLQLNPNFSDTKVTSDE